MDVDQASRFATIPSSCKALTGSGMGGKNRRDASAFSVRVPIRPLAPQRTSGDWHREHSATDADSSISTKTEAPAADDLGSVILGLSQSVWSGWRRPLMYVQAHTVVRWQRERFRKFWARLSKRQRRRRRRPGTAAELRR